MDTQLLDSPTMTAEEETHENQDLQCLRQRFIADLQSYLETELSVTPREPAFVNRLTVVWPHRHYRA